MTIPLGILEIDRILGGGAASPAVADSVVLGMPHLCLGGLSETWLLKECGHRHWFLLAHAAGRAVPDFRDAAGEPVYAAFVAVTLRDARFDAAHEHDELAFEARLARISRTRFMSVHRLSVRGRPIGEVVMTSVFVRRTEPGLNRSIARVEVAGVPPVGPVGEFADYQATMAALRHGRWAEHLGFVRSDAATLGRLVIDPCPAQDFNGADFLYFSSFQAFVDRAEWALLRPINARATTRRRDLVYHGNIEPGERVAVVLRAVRRHEDEGGQPENIGHWCRVEREADGAPIADAFTQRVPNQTESR
jgi:probable biosynthetic protein (TIGR04099 family)